MRVLLLSAAFLLGLIIMGVSAAANAQQMAARATEDRPDVSGDYQVHLIYALPKDGKDRNLDTDGTIAISFSKVNEWFAVQSGGAGLRLDRTVDGGLDVSFVRLSRTDKQIRKAGAWVRDEIEKEINALGFNDPKKVYLVYYDGRSNYACGGGAWPPKLKGNTAALYLRAFVNGGACYGAGFATKDGQGPRYTEFSAIHEIIHTLGFVPECSPRHTRAGHTSGGNTDLMYAGDQGWKPRELDIGNDDYFGHGVGGCPDLAKSAFLDSPSSGTELPPTWTAGARCTYLGYGKRECRGAERARAE